MAINWMTGSLQVAESIAWVQLGYSDVLVATCILIYDKRARRIIRKVGNVLNYSRALAQLELQSFFSLIQRSVLDGTRHVQHLADSSQANGSWASPEHSLFRGRVALVKLKGSLTSRRVSKDDIDVVRLIVFHTEIYLVDGLIGIDILNDSVGSHGHLTVSTTAIITWASNDIGNGEEEVGLLDFDQQYLPDIFSGNVFRNFHLDAHPSQLRFT